jgi:hypothetical protein
VVRLDQQDAECDVVDVQRVSQPVVRRVTLPRHRGGLDTKRDGPDRLRAECQSHGKTDRLLVNRYRLFCEHRTARLFLQADDRSLSLQPLRDQLDFQLHNVAGEGDIFGDQVGDANVARTLSSPHSDQEQGDALAACRLGGLHPSRPGRDHAVREYQNRRRRYSLGRRQYIPQIIPQSAGGTRRTQLLP